MALDVIESLCGFLADGANPLGRSLGKFGMVSGLPGSLCGTQSVALAIEFDLALCQIDQKSRAMPLADDLVDLSNHVRRIWNHDSLALHTLYTCIIQRVVYHTVNQVV